MSDARSARRFRLGVILVLVSVLALGSFWVLEVMRKGADGFLPTPPKSEPDYYVEQFNFAKMSKTGQVHYRISGAKLTHTPQDDSYEIQRPVISSLNDHQPPMTMRAERAVINSDNSKVHMYDNVHLERPASGTSEQLQLKSEYLLILPDDELIQTNKAVEITLGNSRLSGTGMLVNNATREFRLSNRVHGTYQVSPN